MERRYNPRDLRKCVENINSFRNATNESRNADVYIPELPQRRKLTDVTFIITLAICFVVLIGVLAYALTLSDIDRLTNGYDSCGNVCGKENKPIDGIPCRQDMTDKPYIFLQGYDVYDESSGHYKPIIIGTCAVNWTNVNYTGNAAMPGTRNELVKNLVEMINSAWGKLITLCFIGLAISTAMLCFFRFFVSIFVWTMIVACEFVLIASAVVGWYMFSLYGAEILSFPIIMTIVAGVYSIVLWALLPRIPLIILCLKEAVDIIFFMPWILLQPFLAYVVQFVAFGIFIYATFLMTTAGNLVKIEDRLYPSGEYITYYDYEQNWAIVLARIFNKMMYIWVVTLILACQQIVVSGAVAACYFTRDKLMLVTLGSPIYNSFYNLVRFHLGSAAFGSFIVTLSDIIKATVRSKSSNKIYKIFAFCVKPLAELLKYLTSMAYIQIALHGQSLRKSGTRAVNLLLANAPSALDVNNIGISFVLFLAKVSAVGITGGIGAFIYPNPYHDPYPYEYFWIVIAISGVVTYFCAHCIFVVFEIALDATFMCYCEDQCLNDGVVNPYFATLDVHGWIQEFQKYQEKLEEKKRNKMFLKHVNTNLSTVKTISLESRKI